MAAVLRLSSNTSDALDKIRHVSIAVPEKGKNQSNLIDAKSQPYPDEHDHNEKDDGEDDCCDDDDGEEVHVGVRGQGTGVP